MVALSTADTNKWATLLNGGKSTRNPQVTRCDYERTGPIRQRQRRLSEAQALQLANKYQTAASVCKLAKEFGISRRTVSERLKKAGTTAVDEGDGNAIATFEFCYPRADFGDDAG